MINPPIPLNFRAISRAEAKTYFEWFQNQIPARINEITRYVQSTVNFEDWKCDGTPLSLDRLGNWFCQHVSIRDRTAEEIEETYGNSPDWFRAIQIPDYEISQLTVSLSMDVAMYLSNVMQTNVVGLKWKLITRSKNSGNYQQPVLAGNGKMAFNPYNIVMTYAYGIARGTKGPNRLRELYEIWANILQDE
jgi:hypothetical protein